MMVQSLSPTRWFDAYLAFAGLFGVQAQVGELRRIGVFDGIPLYVGWCRGDQRFHEDGAV
jgi:hypothetical protein